MTDAIHIGGLFRCCIQSLEEQLKLTDHEEGAVVKCAYCSGSVEKKHDGWHWVSQFDKNEEGDGGKKA